MLLRGPQISEPVRARMVLYGWFQRWEYYRGHEETIRRWLVTDAHSEPAGENDLAVCLRTRRPESWEEPGIHPGRAPRWKKPVPDPDLLTGLLGRLSFDRLVLFTDDFHCEAVQKLAPFNPVTANIDSFASWRWLRTFPRMVLPLCHPADWWAAWLSDPREIYAVDPWPSRVKNQCAGIYGCGWLGGRPLARPDLRVNEPRWIYEW